MAQAPGARSSEIGYIREQLGEVVGGIKALTGSITSIEQRQVERGQSAQSFEEKMLQSTALLGHDLNSVKQTVYPKLEQLSQQVTEARNQLDSQRVQLEAARVQLEGQNGRLETHIGKTADSFAKTAESLAAMRTETESTHKELADLKIPVNEIIELKKRVVAVVILLGSAFTVVWGIVGKIWSLVGDRVIHSVFGSG